MSRAPGWTERMAATERRLTVAALDLFEEHGFDAVTVAAVARAADVGERTAYRYFPTKEHLALGDMQAEFTGFVAVLHEAPADLSVVEAVLWATDLASAPDIDMEVERRRAALLRATPALQLAWGGALDAVVPLLGGWVAARTGRDPASVEVRVAAGALVTAHRTIVLEWDGVDLDSYREVAARAMRTLDGGLRTL